MGFLAYALRKKSACNVGDQVRFTRFRKDPTQTNGISIDALRRILDEERLVQSNGPHMET